MLDPVNVVYVQQWKYKEPRIPAILLWHESSHTDYDFCGLDCSLHTFISLPRPVCKNVASTV
jgi:hypothetical protein